MLIVELRYYKDIIVFSFLFSIFFCTMSGLADNLVKFWMFLELGSLSLIPRFFLIKDSRVYGFYRSLLSYIIMSGLSSVFLVSGLIFDSLYYFIFVGFIVKLGLFPFSFWVYRVFRERKWNFIFLLRVIMKFPVLFFCFLYSNECLSLVYVDCFLTIFMCSRLIWLLRFKWEYIWGHISLSSVSTLVVRCFCSEIEICYFIYFYYAVWSIGCLAFLAKLDDREQFSNMFWLYCFLLLVTPVSVPLFYKLAVCYGILYSTLYILLIWCLYRLSEQFFLYKLRSNFFYDMVYKGWNK